MTGALGPNSLVECEERKRCQSFVVKEKQFYLHQLRSSGLAADAKAVKIIFRFFPVNVDARDAGAGGALAAPGD